jgi:hypothetical protein
MSKYEKKLGDINISVELDAFNPKAKCLYARGADDVVFIFNFTTDKPVSTKVLKKLWNEDKETRALLGGLENVVESTPYQYPMPKEVQLNGWLLQVYSTRREGRRLQKLNEVLGGLAFAPKNKSDDEALPGQVIKLGVPA